MKKRMISKIIKGKQMLMQVIQAQDINAPKYNTSYYNKIDTFLNLTKESYREASNNTYYLPKLKKLFKEIEEMKYDSTIS